MVNRVENKFRIECIKRKFSIQKLSERAVDLYMTDEEFRRTITNHDLKI